MTFKRLALIDDLKILAQERAAEMHKDGRLGAIVTHRESVDFVRTMISFEEHFRVGPLLDIKWIKTNILHINGAVSIPHLQWMHF
jgi:phosphoribosyl-dephospho-CoA transferase